MFLKEQEKRYLKERERRFPKIRGGNFAIERSREYEKCVVEGP